MLTSVIVDDIVLRALREDLHSGDITTEATVASDQRARAVARAKSRQVVCGTQLAERTFRLLDAELEFHRHVDDGVEVEAGSELWSVVGSARSLLCAERCALNFVQRMGGVATLTRRYVAELPSGTHTRIVDTRKTTPGLRALERYAVRVGGGHNHRDNLGAQVMIKDNHIRASGGVERAVERAKRTATHSAKIEVEVETLEMLDQALAAGADIVMLDNFPDARVEEAVTRARGLALVEVSGNVTLQRVAALARAGVDVISVGALTHSAAAVDISLWIELLA